LSEFSGRGRSMGLTFFGGHSDRHDRTQDIPPILDTGRYAIEHVDEVEVIGALEDKTNSNKSLERLENEVVNIVIKIFR